MEFHADGLRKIIWKDNLGSSYSPLQRVKHSEERSLKETTWPCSRLWCAKFDQNYQDSAFH